MTVYALLLSFLVSLFFTACNSTPDVPLSPELDQYALVKENCEKLRVITVLNVPDALEKECRIFLKRLDKSNALDYKVAHFNDDITDPTAKPKPEYILLQTDANRQRRRTEVDYETLRDTLNKVSLEAIAQNKLEDVELTLTFAETKFTKEHYDYYTKQSPKQMQDPQYLAFKKNYAEELVKEGLVFLSQGDKKGANRVFKAAASLESAQAEYLIGIIYEAKHPDKAIEWHTKAKEHGIKGSRVNLARLYIRQHDRKEAQKLYLEAAEDGDAYVQHLLYKQYKKTSNTKTNTLAREWLKRSAENGFPPAEYDYAKELLKEKNTEAAKEWLLKAHAHGIHAANATLGVLYFEEKMYQEALAYLSVAQSGPAKSALAKMYENGLGVEINFYKSYMLYKEALALGQRNASKDIARLSKLKTGKEKAHYSAAKRKERQQQEALVLRNGEEPMLRNLRTKGMPIHIQGLVSLPLQTSQGFIVTNEDGKQYYVIDAEQKANVQQYQYVDMTAPATGNPITVSSNDGLTVDIYQLYFQNHCQQ